MTRELRTFYTLILTQTLSLIGSRISGLVLGIWVYQQTGNATPLTLVAFFGLLPNVILAGFAGVLADRWDRRYVMALSDAGQAIGTLLLLGLFVSGDFELWHLYVVTFLQAMFGVFQSPAFSASVTMLVPDEGRDRANAIMQMSNPAAGIIAPAIAGFVFAFLGVTGAIIIDLLSFALAFVVVLSVKIPRPRKSAEGAAMAGSVWQEMFAGLRYLWHRQVLFWLIMMVMGLNFVMNMAGVLMTPYLLSRTGDEAVYGLIMSVFNAGFLAGAIIIGAWWGTRPRMKTILPSLLAMAVMVIFFGMAQSPWMLAICAFLILLPNAFVNILFQSVLQAKVAPDLQGRVFATIGQIGMLVSPVAFLMAGPLADQVFEPMVGGPGWEPFAALLGSGAGAGIGLMFVISGVFTLLLVIFTFSFPAMRHMEAQLPDYVPQPPDDALQPPNDVLQPHEEELISDLRPA